MTVRRITALLLALTILIGASPLASADDLFGPPGPSHKYCPRGAKMYWFYFGFWCEDMSLSGVHPIECKSGPGQPPGTWNNGTQSPDQLCNEPGSFIVND